MKNLNLITLFLFLILLGAAGCTKKKYENDPLKSEWLLPLLKGNLTPLTLTSLKNKQFSIEVSAADLGITESVPQSNPVPVAFYNVASYEVKTNDLVSNIQLDTCHLQLTIKNNFPIPIKQGTAISIRDGSGANTLLKNFVFTKDIANGEEEVFDIDLSGLIISNKLKATVDTLIVDAYENKVFEESIEFDFLIKSVSLNYVNLFTNQSYNINDTVDFDGSTIDFDEYDEKITDSTVNGKLSFLCNNELPVNTSFQIYFLDENKNVVDSLFIQKPNIIGGVYSGLNFVAAQKSSFFTTISKQRLIKIKAATKIAYGFEFNTNNYNAAIVQIDKERMLALKLIGDIKLVLNSLLF